MVFFRMIFALALFFSIRAPSAQASRDDVIAALETARKAFEVSEYTKAVQILEDAAASGPQNAEIQYWLLRSHFELEQSDKAVRSGKIAGGRKSFCWERMRNPPGRSKPREKAPI